MEFLRLDFQNCSATEFISFWSDCYEEGKYSDKDYEKNLNRNGLLTPKNIQFLFEWKNDNSLSSNKQRIADKIKSKVAVMNAFRQLPSVSDKEFNEFWSFTSSLIASGIVYRVFLLHIARPDDYPIVDRHVLRAWHYLTNRRAEIPEQNLENYRKYGAFFLELAKQSGKDSRRIDRALMAFGQYLTSQFFQRNPV